MKWALVDGLRIEAQPGLAGVCPSCGSLLIAKCGAVLRWHWSHRSADCDPWTEPETAWHLGWKNHFPESWQEVVIGNHRADICTPNGWVIELQHSPISWNEIQEREWFYALPPHDKSQLARQMLWVIDAASFVQNFDFRNKGDYWAFRWKHPRRSWFAAKFGLYLDFCGTTNQIKNRSFDENRPIFAIEQIHDSDKVGGWGHWINLQEFAQRVGLVSGD